MILNVRFGKCPKSSLFNMLNVNFQDVFVQHIDRYTRSMAFHLPAFENHVLLVCNSFYQCFLVSLHVGQNPVRRPGKHTAWFDKIGKMTPDISLMGEFQRFVLNHDIALDIYSEVPLLTLPLPTPISRNPRYIRQPTAVIKIEKDEKFNSHPYFLSLVVVDFTSEFQDKTVCEVFMVRNISIIHIIFYTYFWRLEFFNKSYISVSPVNSSDKLYTESIG